MAIALSACRGESRVDALIRQLEEGRTVDERHDAARALGRLPGRIPIRSHDRLWIGIGPLPPDRDVERAAVALRRALRDPGEDSYVRREAASSLGQLRLPGPHLELVECAMFDEDVSRKCAWAIQITADPEDLQTIADALGSHPRGASREVRHPNGETPVWIRVVRFPFHEMGPLAVPYLERVLRADRDDEGTLQAMFALGMVGTEEAYDALTVGFDDPHDNHRAVAVMLFEEAGAKAAKHAPAIYRLLDDRYDRVRIRAARALGIPTVEQ